MEHIGLNFFFSKYKLNLKLKKLSKQRWQPAVLSHEVWEWALVTPGKAGAEVKYEKEGVKESWAQPDHRLTQRKGTRTEGRHYTRSGQGIWSHLYFQTDSNSDRKRWKTKSKETNWEINTTDQTRCNTAARTMGEVVELRGGERSMWFSETLQLKKSITCWRPCWRYTVKGKKVLSLLRKSGKINRFHVLKVCGCGRGCVRGWERQEAWIKDDNVLSFLQWGKQL